MSATRFDEYEFLGRLRSFGLGDDPCIVPIGDDAAVVPAVSGDLALALDTVIEGVHAEGPEAPEALARKVLRSNLSDLAAMGAEPLCFLLSLTLPQDAEAALAERVMSTLAEEARTFGVAIIGGDTVVAPAPLTLSGSIVGRLEGAPFRRDGANPGDLIAVTGALGGSILGRHASFAPRLEEAREMRRLGGPTAATDVSDGLLRDAANIAEASGVALEIMASAVPIHEDAHRLAKGNEAEALDAALRDGEDFELLFTWPASRGDFLVKNWKADAPITVIGRVIDGEGLRLDRGKGPQRVAPGGFSHGVSTIGRPAGER